MKRVSALLFCLLSASLIYAQAIEMATIIPTTPSAVVDELRVLGSNTDSQITNMNIGVLSSGEDAPYQTQKLTVGGANSTISGTVSAGRDLVANEKLNVTSMNIGNNGTLFTKATSFPYVEAGTFRAKNIVGPTASNTIKANALSGKAIEVNGATFASPFARGTAITKRKPAYVATEQNDTNKVKYHIYGPWGNLQASAPTGITKCNNSGALCTKNNCSACVSGGATSCVDVRNRTLPNVYDAAGATYEKVGTVKFYCKPSDTYDNNGNLTSSCRHYMVVTGKNGTQTKGFTSGSNAVSNPFPNMSTSTGYNANTVAEKCHALHADGATSTQSHVYFVNASTQEIESFDTAFAENCNNAETAWPAGSGLNCKAQEKVLDIYELTCYAGSGRLARAAGTWYQQRTVYCQQYDNVYTSEHSNIGEVKDRYFFYPDFALSLSEAYDTAMATEMQEAAINHNNLVAH